MSKTWTIRKPRISWSFSSVSVSTLYLHGAKIWMPFSYAGKAVKGATPTRVGIPSESEIRLWAGRRKRLSGLYGFNFFES